MIRTLSPQGIQPGIIGSHRHSDINSRWIFWRSAVYAHQFPKYSNTWFLSLGEGDPATFSRFLDFLDNLII